MDAMEADPYRKDNITSGTRRKRSEDDADEPSKRHKHHHHKDKDKDKDKHRHHHRHHKHKHHHSKKHRGTETGNSLPAVGDGIEKEQGFRLARVSANDEKEEGEIVEDEEEEGGKPGGSEIESGEIQPEEATLILMGLDSATTKVCTDQSSESKDGQNEVKHEFTSFSQISDKNDRDGYNKSVEGSNVEMFLVEKDLHLNDRNGRNDGITGKIDTCDGIKGEKYCKVVTKIDRFDGNKMTVQGGLHRNQGLREICEDGNGQSGRNQPLSEEANARTIRDDRKHPWEQKDSLPEDDFTYLNQHSYSRPRKESFSENTDTDTRHGHTGTVDSSKGRDNERRQHRSHSIDDHKEERYSESLLKFTEKERYRRERHSLSPSKDIEQERQQRQGHLGSPLKYTESVRQSRQENSKFPLKGTERDRLLGQDFSQSPIRDSEKERQCQIIGAKSKELTKDLKYYSQPIDSGVKDDIEGNYRNSQYKERYQERRNSKSRDINKDKLLDKDMSRSPEIPRDKHRDKGLSPSRDRYRDRGQSTSRDGHRDKGQSPPRDRYRDRVQSPSRDRYIDRVRSPSRDRYRDRVRSPSRDRHRDRGRSSSRDRIRDRGYGVKRSRSREARERYSDLRERARVHGELRKRSRSRDRSSRDHIQRARRSNSRDISKAGRTDDRYDRHHRYGYDRQSDRDKQRDRTLERERYSKHQESTRDFKEDKEKIREEENQEEYQERVALQLAEQEEDDVEKIKEESRKRRQAILEKYRQQKLKPEIKELGEQEATKDAHISSVDNLIKINTDTPQILIRQSELITGQVDNGQDGSDIFVPDSTFSVGKEPQQNGILPKEITLSTGGLGEGSPKSDVAADTNTPKRRRKQGFQLLSAMAIPRLFLFLLISLPFVNIWQVVSSAEVEETDVIDEGGELGIVGDGVQDFGDPVLGTAPGVVTVCFFPKNSDKSIPAGEETELLVGINNDGEVPLKVHSIKGSLHWPFDHKLFVQNLTLQEFTNDTVPQSTQATFLYSFAVSKYLQPGSFDLVGSISYEVDEQLFQTVFYNGTIEVVDAGGVISIETVFLITLGLALIGLLGVWVHGQIQRISQKTKKTTKIEVGTRNSDITNEWLKGTAFTQKPTYDSSTQRRSKKKK